MNHSWILAKNLDIWKMDKACNSQGCQKSPTKKVLIFQSNTITHEKKDLASLYFCTEHYNDKLIPIIQNLNEACGKRIKIFKKVKEIGYITH